MRFQCLDVACGKKFGWTAKRIVTYPENEKGETVTEETVRCPYCGSLNFEELPPPPRRNLHGKPTAKTENHTKNLSIPNMEPETPQFDAADLIQHEGWKNRKQGEGNYTTGSLSWGWDFKDQFNSETLRALAQAGGVLEIDNYSFKMNGGIVSTRKVKQ
jgi:DNA-directed RNA polymerase subunit RPC12/RpoP